jgi:pimeloyl-ACP methyl ester carboxylesterase
MRHWYNPGAVFRDLSLIFQLMEQSVKQLSEGAFRQTIYRDAGAGFPVMLVHGFPIEGRLWDAQAAVLQQHFRLLIPDLPGSGASPLKDHLSIEAMAECLNDILVQENIDQCVLIGHSMGGYATLAFAEKHPGKLKGFGLFHSSARADTEEKKKGRLRSVDMMRRYGAGVFLRQMIPTLFAGKFRKHEKARVQALIAEKADAEVEALAAYYEAMRERPDRTAVLRQTKTPVLFVIGKEDSAAPARDVLPQVSLPAVSEVYLLEQVAHLGMLEAPAASADVLEQFIRFCVAFPFVTDNTPV